MSVVSSVHVRPNLVLQARESCERERRAGGEVMEQGRGVVYSVGMRCFKSFRCSHFIKGYVRREWREREWLVR